MQTLNVGAGRSDQEYKAAEEQRLADLRSDVQTYAMYFFVAAGLAGLGTGLLPIRLFGFVNIGFIDLLTFYGGELVRSNPLLLRAAAATWVLALVGLGLAGRKGQRWAFWAGVILYAADMLPLVACFRYGLLAFMASSFGLLIDAAKSDWSDVEPAIFGTLLERALSPGERHRLGAHYTPRAYVERLVVPTIVQPLRYDWNSVQAAAVALQNAGKTNEAIAAVEKFHKQLWIGTFLHQGIGKAIPGVELCKPSGIIVDRWGEGYLKIG